MELAGDRREGGARVGEDRILQRIGYMRPFILVGFWLADVQRRLAIPVHAIERLYQPGTAAAIEHHGRAAVTLLKQISFNGPEPRVDIIREARLRHHPFPLEDVERGQLVILRPDGPCRITYDHDRHALVAWLQQPGAQARPDMVDKARIVRGDLLQD